MTPSLTVALVAGVLSFLSPCVLPLVPSYLAYVAGSSASRATALRNSFLFVLGFSIVFVALGASASFVGGILLENRSWLIRAGGLLVLLFGLMLFGVFRVPFLYRSVKAEFSGDAGTPLGATLMGVSFGVGWTPCIGPVLGAILTLAGASGTVSQGATLLGTYALGLALPFLLAAVGVGAFTRLTARFRHYLPWVERLSGGILVVAGLLMMSGSYTRLNTYLIRLTPQWLFERL